MRFNAYKPLTMKFSKVLLLFLPLVFSIESCQKKNIISAPIACITLSASTVHLKDTLVISNCSKCDRSFVAFYDSAHVCPAIRQASGQTFTFNSQNKLLHTFTSIGINYIYLTAMNNETGSPIKFDSLTVRVLP